MDAGLYSKYSGQHAIFDATPLRWLPPSNWDRAVGVNFVRVVAYMEPSGATETKRPCVLLLGTAKEGNARAVETDKTICFSPDGARKYSLDLEPPDGVGWTPKNLANSWISIAALRGLPEGPRVYLAEVYVLVSYQVR